MHRSTSPQLLRNALPPSRRAHPQAAFSLVEVTLAIGIIAFAFVALFGLLPTGMATFRASVDATNDITIMQEMNAMVQVTAWQNLDNLDSNKATGDVYYFDEEGRRTDTKLKPSSLSGIEQKRLYQVKLLLEPAYQPGNSGTQLKDAKRVVVVIGDRFRPQSKKDFESVSKASELSKNGKSLDVRSRAFIIARMESVKG